MPSIVFSQRPPVRPTTGGVPDIRGLGRVTSSPGGDSLRRRKEDSLSLVYYYLDSTRTHTLDSSISDFTRYFPIPADYITLGNTGTAAQSLLFNPVAAPGWDPGFHALDIYRRRLENARFFTTYRPYTELNYLLGPRAEQIIEILHTQNIKPTWNASFNYRMINAPGLFRNQRVNHNNYLVTSWYQSPNRRYNNYLVFLLNKLKAGENGGIKTDQDYLNDPVYDGDRFTVPTKLGGNPRFGTDFFSTALYTGRQEKDLTLFLRQQYDFGRKDSLVTDTLVFPLFFPKVRFEHDLTFTRSSYRYQDFQVQDNRQSNTPDSAYYASRYNINIRNDSVLFEDKWSVLGNQFSFYQFPDEKNLQQFIKVGAELQLIKGNLKSNVNLYNFVGHGEYRNRTRNQKWDMVASGQLYLAGFNAGDYKAYIHLQRLLGENLGSLRIGFENINRTPPFIYQPESNFYLTAFRDFNKENTAHFFANWTEPKLQLELKGDYYLVSNYLYLRDFYKLQQEAALFNVLKISATKKFVLSRHLNWYADAAIQQKTGSVQLNLPFFYTRNRIAFEGLFFRNLNLSTGLEIRYNTPYQVDNYSPVLGRFFYQDSISISNRPDVAAFFHFRIRSFKAFLRAENLNTISSNGQFLDHNFSAPDYPRPGFFLRLGLYWSFVN